MKEYLRSSADVIEEVASSADGLSSSEAAARLEKNGKNKLAESKKEPVIKLFFKQFSEPMTIILIIAAAISGAIEIYEGLSSGHFNFPADVVIILSVVIINAVLGVLQESKAEKAIEALKHDIVIDEAVAPKCGESGLTQGEHCTRCDYKVEQKVIPATGHSEEKDVISGTAATCTTRGLTDGEKCKTCKAWTTKQTVIPATGHSLVKTEEKAGGISYQKIAGVDCWYECNFSGNMPEQDPAKKGRSGSHRPEDCPENEADWEK